MAITIKIDNDQTTVAVDNLALDESSGLQTPGTTDTGNDSNLDITDATTGNPDSNLFDGTLSGASYSASFLSFMNAATIFGSAGLRLSDVQKAYAAGVEGAVSATDFVKVTATNGETVSDLFFSDSAGAALNGDQVLGMQTLDGQNVYLWSDGDYCIATTSSSAGAGRVVAAFYLKDDAADHLSAQVQMVMFEPLKHPDGTSVDDALNFTNVMNVSAAGSQTFDFDALKSGGCLWCAVGSNAGAILVSGYSLDVDGVGKLQATSNKIAVSQGGTGTTIGLNNQLFDNVNETAVFTLVTGLDTLGSTDGGVQSDYLLDHTGPKADGLDYSGYINVTGAGIFISQSQGNDAKSFDINLFEAGGGTTPEEGLAYIGTEPSGAFLDDTAINVATVTVIDDDGNVVATWVAGADPDGAGPLLGSGATVSGHTSSNGTANIQVTISGNNIDVNGVLGEYTVNWTSAGGVTFNRFTLVDEAGQFDVGRVDLTQGVAVHQAIGGALLVQDDGPSPSGANATFHVDEDAMTGAGGGDLSTGNIDNPDDGDGIVGEQDEVTFTQADLGVTVSTGTDSPAIFSLVGSIANGTAVKTNSGADVYSKGDQVFWRVSSGVLQGVTDAGTADERVIFTITVNDQGTPAKTDDTFTFDLKDQLDHSNGAGELANLVLNITPAFTATDADGDPVNFGTNTPIRMQIENDTPTFTAQISDGLVEFATDSTGTVTNSLNGAVGADDTNATSTSQSPSVKQYTFVNNSWTEPHDVYPDLDGVLSADGTKITFYSTSVTADQNSSTAVYEITLNQTANSGAGSYTFTVLQAPPVSQNAFDFSDLPSGQNLCAIIASDKTDLSQGGLLVFPSNPDLNPDGTFTNISGTINTSKGGGPVTIGNGNQAFDHTDEGAWFIYVDDPSASAVGGLGLTQVTADDADTIDFTGTLGGIDTASVEIVQASGAGTAKRPGPSMHIATYDVDPGDVSGTGGEAVVLDPTAVGAGADQVNIIGVKIINSSGQVIEYRINIDNGATNGGTLQDSDDAGTAVTAADDSLVGVSFVLDDDGGTPADPTDDIYSIIVSNLKANYTVEFITETSHDAALVENVSGSFDIGGFNTFSNQDVPSQDFDFQVQVNDYDNDSFTSTLAQFSVSIDGINF
jgi:hypothetical protein